MGRYPCNSVTEFAHFKIKRNLFFLFFTVLGIGLSIFLFMEMIFHVKALEEGRIGYSVFLSACFYTFMVLGIVAATGLLALATVLIISTIRYAKKIRYYGSDVFSFTMEIEPVYDYKLWQTAPKNSFHSMSIPVIINGEKKMYASDIIFTNSKKIGLFRVPEILQSHSYVVNRCKIGYNEKKDEVIILSVVKKED